MAKKDIHVVPAHDGWVVKKGSQSSTIHNTQREAIAKARDTARRERTTIVVHGRDGRIRDTDTYGLDPMPPRDVKPAPRTGTIPVVKIREAARRAKH
jgi:Uncharacterized protein conserved in bacteria (DUF2188)